MVKQRHSFPRYDAYKRKSASLCVIGFREFLRTRRVTDNPRGDFIADARRDPRLPDVQRWSELETYLRLQGDACPEAVRQAKRLWQEFERQRTGGENDR
jgi:hypothetical protein